jgi:hypothetical protein
MVKKSMEEPTNNSIFLWMQLPQVPPDKGRRDLVFNRHSYSTIKISFTDVEVF